MISLARNAVSRSNPAFYILLDQGRCFKLDPCVGVSLGTEGRHDP